MQFVLLTHQNVIFIKHMSWTFLHTFFLKLNELCELLHIESFLDTFFPPRVSPSRYYMCQSTLTRRTCLFFFTPQVYFFPHPCVNWSVIFTDSCLSCCKLLIGICNDSSGSLYHRELPHFFLLSWHENCLSSKTSCLAFNLNSQSEIHSLINFTDLSQNCLCSRFLTRHFKLN